MDRREGKRSIPWRGAPLVFAGLSLLIAFTGARPSSDGLVLDMLRPGTRTAVGLGGDPFLRTTGDETGWWGSFMDLPGRALSIDGSFGKPLTEGITGDWGAVSHDQVALRFSHEDARRDLRVRFGGTLLRPHTIGAWDGANGEFRVADAEARAEGGVRITHFRRRLDIQATVPLWREDRNMPAPAGRVGIRWRPMPSWVFQAEGGRAADLQIVAFEVEGEPGAASLNSWTENTRWEGAVDLPAGFRIAGAAEWARYREIEPVRTAPEYQLLPYGTGSLRQAEALWGGGKRVRLLYRWTSREYALEGEAYWSYERFGLLSYCDVELESHLIAAEGGAGGFRWVVDAERVRASGGARGKVEFWPFTEALIDLVGPRRTYRIVGDAEWFGLHAGIESDGARRLRWRAGLNGYDIYPEFCVESWRPAFLLFGQSDYEKDDLNVERLQLGALSLGAEFDTRGFTARLEIQQFVFARVTKSTSPVAPGEPKPEDGGDYETASESWTDGSRLRFALTRAF